MLLSLKVKNYALISDVNLEFYKGLNIITGETGAGKSILIGALGLTLGKRADTTSLRNKKSKCIVEAEFNIKAYNLKTYFDEYDLDYDDITYVRREISPSGKSRAFINDTPVKLKTLSELGEGLLEIHSQHDNLSIFKKPFQVVSLDTLSNAKTLQEDYTTEYKQLKKLKKELEVLKEREAELKKESDFNQFLFDELEKANLDQVDENGLENEQELLENAEDLIRAFNEADHIFTGTEFSLIEQIQTLKRLLLNQNTSFTEKLVERISSLDIELQDISSEISQAADNVEVNPDRLEEVNERLGLLFNLKSKHRAESLKDLLQIQEALELKLSETNNLGVQIGALEEQLLQLNKQLTIQANKLHVQRTKGATGVENDLNEMLSKLGMQHSRLKFIIDKVDRLTDFGFTNLELHLSSDKGETFKDLKKSASGGELARINLSLKSKLANFEDMPTSIFDEIDTGVSGEIARKVGSVMHGMSGNQQIIVITHLPQIASLGENHLFVYKTDDNGVVNTKVKILKGDDRISEIAKMISGDNLTEHALEQSKALLTGK